VDLKLQAQRSENLLAAYGSPRGTQGIMETLHDAKGEGHRK